MCRFACIAIVIFLYSVQSHASSLAQSCSKIVSDFEVKYGKVPVSPVNKAAGKESFVFFLHVPRTAGKTYSTCFIAPSMKPSERCLPGYDRYRYKQSVDGCKYYVSHDDLSFVDVSLC